MCVCVCMYIYIYIYVHISERKDGVLYILCAVRDMVGALHPGCYVVYTSLNISLSLYIYIYIFITICIY